MSFRRLVLAAALSVPLLGGVAAADLKDDCWNAGLGFRVGALVCGKIPPGIG